MLIIGLGHRARHGKDTVAQTIIAKRGDSLDIRQYSFAQALKDEVSNAVYDLMYDDNVTAAKAMEWLCGWASQYQCRNPETGKLETCSIPYDQNPFMGDPLCPYGKQSRLLQWWGTEYRRWSDPNYWVRRVEKRITSEQPDVALITDLRFPNEFWWVKDKMKGETVKVERIGFTDMSRDPNHTSEHALDHYKFDHEIIVPDGQLEELKRDAVELFDIIVASCTPGPTEDELRRAVEEVDALEGRDQETEAAETHSA